MKSLFNIGLLFFAISLCSADENGTKEEADGVEKAKLTSEQSKILSGGLEAKWTKQGISWTVPKDGWVELAVDKNLFNYGSVDAGFLIGSISTMPANFPTEISQDATYKGALEKVENGEYESVRWLEIDGIKGIEWVETTPEDGEDPQRHQWVGFRTYQGKSQLVSIMVSTKGSRFHAKKEIFAAILYSMKFEK